MDCVNPAFKLFNWAVNKGPDADTEAEAPGHLRRVMSAKPFSKRPLNKSMNYNETPFCLSSLFSPRNNMFDFCPRNGGSRRKKVANVAHLVLGVF